MSIQHTYIFDNEEELVFDTSSVEIVTIVDDESFENPFTSGTIDNSYAGIVDDNLASGIISPNIYSFIASGQPFVCSSGDIVTFNFGSPRILNSIELWQNVAKYAVDYKFIADNNTDVLIVQNSTNSGNIFHTFADPVETQTLKFNVTKISSQSTSGNAYYELFKVSGEANKTFVETKLPLSEVSNISATSVVEPVENLYDEDALTFWQSNNTLPQEVIWSFNSQKTISQFNYVSEDTVTYPTAWELYKSDDNSTYTSVASASGLTSGNIDTSITPFASKYLKWNITASVGSKVRVREVEIFKREIPQVELNKIQLKKTVSNGLTTAGSLSATNEDGSNVVTNLVNDGVYWKTQAGTFTLVSGTSFYTGYENIKIDLTSDATIDSLKATFGSTAGIPSDFELLGSDDNVTYISIKKFTGNVQQSVNFNFTNVNTYRFYRLDFTKSNASYVRVDSLMINTRTYPASSKIELPIVVADSITSFDVIETSPYPATDVKYAVLVDNQLKWFNGNAWVNSDGTLTNSNSLSTINNNISTLTIALNAKVSLAILLQSDGTDTPIVTSTTAKTVNEETVYIPSNRVRIYGYLYQDEANNQTLQAPFEMQISLRRSSVQLADGETLVFNVRKIYSDSNGFFDFTIPSTEFANPAKSRYVITVQSANLRRERYAPAVNSIKLSDWIAGNF